MTIKIWNDFKNGGFVLANYTFLRSLDVVSALVLCQLIAEYNYASNNHLNLSQYFLANLTRIKDYLGFTDEDLQWALKILEGQGFISVNPAGIDDTILIYIHEENIIEFKQEFEMDARLHEWNWGLLNVQNPRGHWNFESSTNVLIEFIEQHLKNPEQIPAIVYVYCNCCIEVYEASGECFLDINDLEDELIAVLNRHDFQPMDIAIFVNSICNKKGEQGCVE